MTKPRTAPTNRVLALAGLMLTTLAVFAIWVAPGARAAVPGLLVQTPADGIAGTEGGRLTFPGSVAASPNLPGDVYVADSDSNRVAEYTPWGAFVKVWGWGVSDSQNQFEQCSAASTCQSGIAGSAGGQLNRPGGVAVAPNGDIYVGEGQNHRIQVFDAAGDFAFTFGDEVNKTKVEEAGASEAEKDVCTAASGNTCQAGTTGTGPGQLGTPRDVVIDTTSGAVLVGEENRIQKFSASGAFVETIALELPAGTTLNSLAADDTGILYVTFEHFDGSLFVGNTEVKKLKSTGPVAEYLTSTIQVDRPVSGGLTVDPSGNVFVSVRRVIHSLAAEIEPGAILEFDSEGVCLNCGSNGEGGKPGFDQYLEGNPPGLPAIGAACGPADLYVARGTPGSPNQASLRFYGEPPDTSLCPPPQVPPTIAAQFASSVTSSEASVKAEINPHFWPDTTYYVQYGTGKCSEGGCENEKPLPPGATLSSKTIGSTITSAAVLLSDLQPDTIYHYRFVAQSGGGPVRGVGGEGGADGAEATFNTLSLPSTPKTDCPNQALRGASAKLPDCRAYEMVSPLDKNGGNVATTEEASSYGPLAESSASGDRATFSSLRSFGEPDSAPLVSQYISIRGPEGWSTSSISPPRLSSERTGGVSQYGRFEAFTEDLCSGWVFQDSAYPLVSTAPVGYPNLYRQDNCGGGLNYELLSPTAPTGIAPFTEEGNLLAVDGFSADLSHSVISSLGGLTKDSCAKPVSETAPQIYETSNGGEQLRLISALPSGKASCTYNLVGHGELPITGFKLPNLPHAVSADASRVYWSTEEGGRTPTGLYVRVNASQPQSKVSGTHCTEPEKACTLTVALGKPVEYWDASKDGSRALYSVGELGSAELFEYDLETNSSSPVAEDFAGYIGASEDLSRFYFLSKEVLTEEANGVGEKAAAGRANLYLREGGSTVFVAGGASEVTLSAFGLQPVRRTARVTPDGMHLAFTSSLSLTGYDNTSQSTGKAVDEVYLYDAVPGSTGRLRCISCNPSGARPESTERKEGFFPKGADVGVAPFAATMPGWQEGLRASRLLTADGDRLFFESYDPLLPNDTNGKIDVYEWERGGDAAACEEDGAELFVKTAGGCLSLISSGKSVENAELIDASKDGRDVFFTTGSSLLSQDPGLVDLYDARSEGGYPVPTKTAACEGEACQGPLAPPNDPTPGSSSFEGAGNVKATRPQGRRTACAKAEHRAKHSCAKHKKAKRHGKANKKGRASR